MCNVRTRFWGRHRHRVTTPYPCRPSLVPGEEVQGSVSVSDGRVTPCLRLKVMTWIVTLAQTTPLKGGRLARPQVLDDKSTKTGDPTMELYHERGMRSLSPRVLGLTSLTIKKRPRSVDHSDGPKVDHKDLQTFLRSLH